MASITSQAAIHHFSDRMIVSLEKAIAFHQNNPEDPYGISQSVIIALVEVKTAVEAARDEIPLPE
jgi:hypothetical protein